MAKLPNGKSNKHVAESTGANKGIMDFYITEYSSNQGIEGFLPRIGKHSGTGYKSNFRPGVYYSRKLDELDNPAMGKLLKENYLSSTQESFQPYKDSDGTAPFGRGITNRETGFSSNYQPTYEDVGSAKSTQSSLATSKALLGINPPREKTGVSESRSQFQERDPRVDTSGKSVGRKEETGFTHSKNNEPVTHRPDECYNGGYPTSPWRQTGQSVTRTSFLPSQLPHGDEKFQNIALNSEQDNGFTRFIRPTAEMTGSKKDTYTRLGDLNPIAQKKIMKNDPCEHINLLHPYPHLSMKQAVFQGRQVHPDTLIKQKNIVGIGEKEDTGYTSNNKGVVCLPNEQRTTVYEDEFFDKNGILRSKGDSLGAGVGDPVKDGYTKNEKLHTGAHKKAAISDGLHPFVSRSLKARDPFYGEKLYEQKKIIKC